MLELVRCTFEGHGGFPWASERILKFFVVVFCGIGSNCRTGEDNVSDQVGVGIRSPAIDQLSVIRPLLLV
jgi:hypothetical protein